MPTSLTRIVRFRATHRYWRPDWPAERNQRTFGVLIEPHSHDYSCGVTVSGRIDSVSGMVMDLAELDRILTEEVVARLDRQDLNDLPPFREGQPLPTCEALATLLFGRILARLPAGLHLERVRVEEDPTLYAECTGAD